MIESPLRTFSPDDDEALGPDWSSVLNSEDYLELLLDLVEQQPGWTEALENLNELFSLFPEATLGCVRAIAQQQRAEELKDVQFEFVVLLFRGARDDRSTALASVRRLLQRYAAHDDFATVFAEAGKHLDELRLLKEEDSDGASYIEFTPSPQSVKHMFPMTQFNLPLFHQPPKQLDFDATVLSELRSFNRYRLCRLCQWIEQTRDEPTTETHRQREQTLLGTLADIGKEPIDWLGFSEELKARYLAPLHSPENPPGRHAEWIRVLIEERYLEQGDSTLVWRGSLVELKFLQETYRVADSFASLARTIALRSKPGTRALIPVTSQAIRKAVPTREAYLPGPLRQRLAQLSHVNRSQFEG